MNGPVPRARWATLLIAVLATASLVVGGWRLASGANVIRIGAVFPLSSNAADLVGPELEYGDEGVVVFWTLRPLLVVRP